MKIKTLYAEAMEKLYFACVFISGLSLVVVTLVIPFGVFKRYVMNSPSSWPEPLAILLMIVFSFLGGAAVFRAKSHMGIVALVEAVGSKTQRVLLFTTHLSLAATCLFMMYYGVELVTITWYQTIAEFPVISVGLSYAPIPVAGAITLLFLIEQIWCGDPPKTSVMHNDKFDGWE